jgi:hypothetical protein
LRVIIGWQQRQHCANCEQPWQIITRSSEKKLVQQRADNNCNSKSNIIKPLAQCSPAGSSPSLGAAAAGAAEQQFAAA